MGVADDEIVEDEGEGSVTDKADLIDDIRAVLEEHTDEGALDKEDEETEAGEDEDEEEDPVAKDLKTYNVAIFKSLPDEQDVYGIVAEPDTIDLQGDRLSKAEIRQSLP